MKSLPQKHKQFRPEECGPYNCFSQWELPCVRMEPWSEQCQPGHELLSIFLLRSVGVVEKKGVLVLLFLHSVLMLALKGFEAQMAAVILLKQLHGDSVFSECIK